MVEILARSLESESNLHKRVDLFFLVDSIAQCSRGLKGEVLVIFVISKLYVYVVYVMLISSSSSIFR